MTTAQLVPTLFIPFIVWRVYRRARRNIGRQPFRPGRLVGRAIFFGVIVGLVAFGAATSPTALVALGGGLAVAVALAAVGLRLTKFAVTPEGEFYTPNTVIGLGVTLVFIARLAYRLGPVFFGPPGERMTPMTFPTSSPLTLFIFGVTAGYYIAYALGVLARGKKELNATVA